MKTNVRNKSFLTIIGSSLFIILILSMSGQNAFGQTSVNSTDSSLSRFDFFYAGEAKSENMYIIRKGKVVWSYTHFAKGEISDAVVLSNNNILFAHQFGITEITPDKKVVWTYDAPEGTEIHTVQPIGKKYVIFIQNGNPAKAIVFDKIAQKSVHEFNLPVGGPSRVHGQFRHARLTNKGTFLVAHMDMGKICEYDVTGKQLLAINAPGVWSAEPLKNGNILVTCKKATYELSTQLDTVWKYSFIENPAYPIPSPQIATRLTNSNTLINNWFDQWKGNGHVEMSNQPLQAIEVTPGKKVVWKLQSWTTPDLGPSTTIIPLNEAHTNEKNFFGRFH